jgi:nitrite reductase/ring-hydroxylating ferredoxin subunit
MGRFVKVIETPELSPGEGKQVDVEGLSIAVFNIEGNLYAIEGNCSHNGGLLGEGEVEGEVVTCPLHGAQFNVKTGKVLMLPAGSDMRRYTVKVDGADVLIEMD